MDFQSFSIYTLGCKLNQVESDNLAGLLGEKGLEEVKFGQKSDIAIINTCAVTKRSTQRARQVIRRARRENPDLVLIVVGCYSQLEAAEIAKTLDVDAVLGTDNRYRVLDIIEDFDKTKPPLVLVEEPGKKLDRVELDSPIAKRRSRAYLKIQDGCDNNCAYCIIPSLRGPSRSYEPQEIEARFGRLALEGFYEIVLTGVHIGMYGRDLPEPVTLVELIERLLKIAPGRRIRLSSLEPGEITSELLELMMVSSDLAPHLHISIQNGSDTILARMNRGYTTALVRDLMVRIRHKLPSAAVGCDIITGFPGEGEKEFAETFEFIDNLDLSYFHVFAFSPRPGTPAAVMTDQVDPVVASARSALLRKISAKKARDYKSRFIGKSIYGLMESSPDSEGFGRAVAGEYFKVRTTYNPALSRKLVSLEITLIDGDEVSGKVIEKDNLTLATSNRL